MNLVETYEKLDETLKSMNLPFSYHVSVRESGDYYLVKLSFGFPFNNPTQDIDFSYIDFSISSKELVLGKIDLVAKGKVKKYGDGLVLAVRNTMQSLECKINN